MASELARMADAVGLDEAEQSQLLGFSRRRHVRALDAALDSCGGAPWVLWLCLAGLDLDFDRTRYSKGQSSAQRARTTDQVEGYVAELDDSLERIALALPVACEPIRGELHKLRREVTERRDFLQALVAGWAGVPSQLRDFEGGWRKRTEALETRKGALELALATYDVGEDASTLTAELARCLSALSTLAEHRAAVGAAPTQGYFRSHLFAVLESELQRRGVSDEDIADLIVHSNEIFAAKPPLSRFLDRLEDEQARSTAWEPLLHTRLRLWRRSR